MGEAINSRKFNIKQYMDRPFPIVLCNPNTALIQNIVDAGYHRYSLNLSLANALSTLSEEDRTGKVRETVFALLPKQQAVYLVDYEMLFDPRYGLDVLKLLYEIARRQKLVVKWCGEYRPLTLVYAEPEYPEFKQYKVADYDIICVNN